MKVGIVGHEEAKFGDAAAHDARQIIRSILYGDGVTEVVSGGCHLGGVDKWAAEIGREMGLDVTEFLPATHSWQDGYKPRNIKIAERSDVVHVIVVYRLPEEYTGMRFKLCYHCKRDDHVKSGACWTAWSAMKLGKEAVWHIINQRSNS